MKDLPLNTLVLLQNAPTDGLILRYFVYVWAKNRDTGATEEIGFWTGKVPISAYVKKPQDGTSQKRDFVGAGQMLTIPSIPATLNTEVRKIRFKLSGITDEAKTLLRTYDARYAKIEIHRGYFDPATNRLADPAECIFTGYITAAPIKQPKAGGENYIDVECSSRSRILQRTPGLLFSLETLKKRSGDLFGQYLDVAGDWRIWWGQVVSVITFGKNKTKEHWLS